MHDVFYYLEVSRTQNGGDGIQTAHLHSVFPMMIAFFDPGHLLTDMCQDCCSALLGSDNGVMV